MENRELIRGLLESVLGKGKKTSRSNYAFHCPFCHHRKPKLEVFLDTNEKGENPWHCWTCEERGKKLESLFKRLNVSKGKLYELRTYLKIEHQISQDSPRDIKSLALPSEFIPLYKKQPTSPVYRQAIQYLKTRGITYEDILKYNLGYCEKGKYRERIVIPSYNSSGSLSYFVARTFKEDIQKKYDAPSSKKDDVIGFENLINWDQPIILCEGGLDGIAIKRNAIPLFGKTISTALKLKLNENRVKTVYIALDNDALKLALKYAEDLMNAGKEVYFVEMAEKDPSMLGFEKFTELLHKAMPLTFRTILSKKLNL